MTGPWLEPACSLASSRAIRVVDHEEAVRLTLGAALTEAGHAVTLSPSGSDALSQVRSTEFDLVLADLRLEDMDGLHVLRRARRG